MAEKYTYKVSGMHCKSCEILIEKKLSDVQGIKSVNADTGKGDVVISCEGQRPSLERLNKIFKQDNYRFSETSVDSLPAGRQAASRGNDNVVEDRKVNPTLFGFTIAIFIVIAFLLLDKMGVGNFLAINSASSLLAFFGFGLLAGVSSCAALVGGIVLSMSKQWNGRQPHIMFNAGRVVSYIVFGGILGLIGNRLQISLQFTFLLIVAVSLLMIGLGLQMLGVKAFKRFQIALPKSWTRSIADERNFNGKFAPFAMGALTFFLPCGFTITAQGLALFSGNALTGGLIMGAFALGTVPALLLIGLFSVKFYSKPHLSEKFSKVAGFLVLFFALFNINAQMNVLGFSWVDFNRQSQNQDIKDLPQIINGKQVIKMTAYGSRDVPNYFKVKAGVPVRWEITADKSAGGCNSSIVATNLFKGSIPLNPGELSVKEFTPQKPGRYRFSCQMGMITGTIEVVN